MSVMKPCIGFLASALVLLTSAIPVRGDAGQSAPTSEAEMSKRIAKIEGQLSLLHDRERVQAVYEYYGRGIDLLDEEAYRKAFWPDAQINYGTKESLTPEQHWKGHMMNGFKAGVKSWAHLFTNQRIDIDHDVAHVETYLTVMTIPKDLNGPMNQTNYTVGRYVDKLERRGGEWRIAVREYMPLFSMKADVTGYDSRWADYFQGATSQCVEHAAGKKDVAYARPLKKRERTAGPSCAQ